AIRARSPLREANMKNGPNKVELRAADLIIAPQAAPERAKRRERKPSVTGEVKRANKAGIPVRSASKAPDGTVTLVFGQPDANNSGNMNEWDDELLHGKH